MENKTFDIKKWGDKTQSPNSPGHINWADNTKVSNQAFVGKTFEDENPSQYSSNQIKFVPQDPFLEKDKQAENPPEPKFSPPIDRIKSYNDINSNLPKSIHPTTINKPRPGWVNHSDEGAYISKTNEDSKTVFSVKTQTFLFPKNDTNTAITELNQSNMQLMEDGERFDFNPPNNSALSEIFKSILQKTSKLNLKIKECYIYKTSPGESIINSQSNFNSNFNFIYTLQADSQTGYHIANLSSIGGPTFNYPTPTRNLLTIFPGWIPFHISRNKSTRDFYAIIGALEKV